MFILYQFSRILGLLFGICLGVAIASFGTGWGGGVIGLVLGIAVGWLAALLPPEIVRHAILFLMRWSGTAQLKERLARGHSWSEFIISELVRRGEPVEQFRDCVRSLLHSDSHACRKLGERIQRRWFPDQTF